MRGDPLGRLAVEGVHRARVAARMIGGLGGDRIAQVLLDLTRPQVRFGDPARDAVAVPGAVVGADVGLGDHPGRLDRDQLGIAGPQPDTPERASAHALLLAIALTAAAAIALPPRRPWTTRYAMPRGRSISSCFDCAEPTKPTGPPSNAAGVGAPSSTSSSNRNNAVGALPMASTAPPSLFAHRSIAAADRVVPFRCARPAALVSATSDTTSLPAGSRDFVMPAATIDESHNTGAPATSAAWFFATTSSLKATCSATSTCPQVWISRTTTRATSSGNRDRSASARIVANDCR